MTTSKLLKVFFLLTAIILSWIIVYFILSRPIKIWKLPSISKAIAFSSDSTMLATGAGKPGSYKTTRNHSIGGVSSIVEIRKVTDGEVIQTFKYPGATSIVFSPDDKLIAAGHRGKEIKVWRVSDGKLISTFEQSGFKEYGINNSLVSYLSFTPDGQNLVSFTQKYSSSSKIRPDTIDVWNIDSGDSRRILSKNFSCAVINPDGKLLAIGGRNKADRTAPLSLYELQTGTLLKVFENQPKGCRQIQFSKDSKLISFLDLDRKKIDIYDTESGKLIRSQHINYVDRNNLVVDEIAFSKYAERLAIAYSAASIEGGFIFPSIPKTFFGRISIWNTKRGNVIKTALRSNEGSNALAFSPDGKLIASAEKDSTIRFWKVPPHNHSWLWLKIVGSLIVVAYGRKTDLINWLNSDRT